MCMSILHVLCCVVLVIMLTVVSTFVWQIISVLATLPHYVAPSGLLVADTHSYLKLLTVLFFIPVCTPAPQNLDMRFPPTRYSIIMFEAVALLICRVICSSYDVNNYLC